jgi:hypothetical protein
MSNILDQCQAQEIEFKNKNDLLQNNIAISVSTTITTNCQKIQPKKLLNTDKRSNFNNNLIFVILFVIMSIINVIDRFT